MVEFYPEDLRPSRISLTMVCGPAGSGKTTWVKQNIGMRDIVIDLDDLMSKVSGKAWYVAGDECLHAAISQRNSLLRSLSLDRTHERAWFIVSAPTLTERMFWREALEPDRVVIHEVLAAECMTRIKADVRRSEQWAKWQPIVDRWWSRYSRGVDEEVIEYMTGMTSEDE